MWYDKFKKIIKVIVVCLLVLAGVASYVLSVVYPEESRIALDKVMEYLDHPVSIAGCSVGAVVLGVYTIISKTSVGRKSVKTIKSECTKVKTEVEEFKKASEEKITALKESYEEKLALVEFNRKQEREFITNALSNVRNVGVQYALEKYKSMENYETISEVVDAEKEAVHKEYEIKFEAFTQTLIADYEKKIAEINAKTRQEATKVVETIEKTTHEEKVAE